MDCCEPLAQRVKRGQARCSGGRHPETRISCDATLWPVPASCLLTTTTTAPTRRTNDFAVKSLPSQLPSADGNTDTGQMNKRQNLTPHRGQTRTCPICVYAMRACRGRDAIRKQKSSGSTCAGQGTVHTSLRPAGRARIWQAQQSPDGPAALPARLPQRPARELPNDRVHTPANKKALPKASPARLHSYNKINACHCAACPRQLKVSAMKAAPRAQVPLPQKGGAHKTKKCTIAPHHCLARAELPSLQAAGTLPWPPAGRERWHDDPRRPHDHQTTNPVCTACTSHMRAPCGCEKEQCRTPRCSQSQHQRWADSQ